MKSILLSSIAAVALVLTGCNGTFNAQNAANGIQFMAFTGANVTMLSNPQYRAGFVAADAALSPYCATNAPFTVADLQAEITKINVGGKPAMYVSLGLSEALGALNLFAGNISSLDPTNQLAMMKMAVCAADAGVKQALGPTP